MKTISEHGARTVLRMQIVGQVECDPLAFDCALLRSSLWALSGGTTPVHVLRLLNLASSALDQTEPEARQRLRDALDELAEAGDAVELANGRWLPAPTREVALNTDNDVRLILGGLPTSLLPVEISSRLTNNGVYRRTKGEFVAAQLGLPAESRTSWLGDSEEKLEDWTRTAFEGQYEGCGDEARYFTYYAPELFHAPTPQALRWTERPDKLCGTYFCRHDLPFGLRRHYAVEVIAGKPTRTIVLHVNDLRRLMYGLDLLAGKSVTVDHVRRGAEFTIVLKSELPRLERRLFGALGTLTFPADAYYPRTWHFSEVYSDEVRDRLDALGIKLSSKAAR